MKKLIGRLPECLKWRCTPSYSHGSPKEYTPLFTHTSTYNKQPARLPQLLAVLSVSLGGFCMGTSLGWTAPIQDDVVHRGAFGFVVTTTDYSVISGLVSLGAMVGSLAAGPICDRIGRRAFVLMNTLPCLVGWSLIIFCQNLAYLYVGRFILGVSTGGFSCACPLYNVEIAEKSIRGMLGSLFQLQIVCGILFSYVVGAIVPLIWFSTICGLVPIILACAMSVQPETPFYYLKMGQPYKACREMQKLRGPHYSIDEEIDAMQTTIYEHDQNKMTFKESFTTKAAKRSLLIGLTLMVFQQFSGANAIIFFASSIFKDAGSTLDPNICTIITGIFSVLGSSIAVQTVERAGRKSPLFISSFSMFILTGTLGFYFFLKINFPSAVDNELMRVVPLVSVCSFQVVFSLGYGPIPWLYIGEVSPPAIKGPASALACFINWLASFVVSSAYPVVNQALTPDFIYVPYWIFALVSFFGSIFVCLFVVETKGKTLNEIQIELGQIKG